MDNHLRQNTVIKETVAEDKHQLDCVSASFHILSTKTEYSGANQMSLLSSSGNIAAHLIIALNLQSTSPRLAPKLWCAPKPKQQKQMERLGEDRRQKKPLADER